MIAILQRENYKDKQVTGTLKLYQQGVNVGTFATLEKGWHNNQRNVSCIPKGEYDVIKCEPNEKRKEGYFWVKNVDGRSEILIHKGNFYNDIKGCILVGNYHTDINKDGLIDVAESGLALTDLYDIAENEFILKII